ncbi:MAG: ureidoglycolate lyase [Kordiimonadales bacterium]|nr:MAG: ureidoglycolate lyase [Kordiimonadales bacterium]
MRTLVAKPLTAEAFAPYGDVIEASSAAEMIRINQGNTLRFHNLMPLDVADGGGSACVNIFRSTPLALPIVIKTMEYHPLGSQAFMPLSGEPYLVVVGKAGQFDGTVLEAFIAAPEQGVNYAKGTWHHFSLALNKVSDFLVLDRQGDGDNCVEHDLSADEQVTISF